MSKCDFNKVALCSPVNLLRIFRTSFCKNTSGGLLLLSGNQPKCNIFELSNWSGLKRFETNSLFDKRSKCGGNLIILLITVNHMASCNLRNLFLEVWNLVQMY